MTIFNLHRYTHLLCSCVGHPSLLQLQQIHLLLLKSGLISSTFAANSLLQAYTRCVRAGVAADARRLFDEMPQKNSFSWNTLIEAYLKSNDIQNALIIFNSMTEKNPFSWNMVVTGLVKLGDVGMARKLFDDMPTKDAIACNAMIHGYVKSGDSQEALCLYRRLNTDSSGSSMACNDSFVLATVVSACADCMAHQSGKQIHSRIVVGQVELDSVLGSAIVDMYGKCGDLDNARLVLESMDDPDEFSLSALISGYAGRGRLADARSVFNGRKAPGVVLWNSMISGYISNDQGEEALDLFQMMMREGIDTDPSTLASVLSSCPSSGVFEKGRQMHALTLKLGYFADIVVASALLDSYSKFGKFDDACEVFGEIKTHDTVLLNSIINVCSNHGRIKDARKVFDAIPNKSLISWNSMIVGYSQNGCAIEALELFSEMRRLDLRPDKVALASAISASASICLLGFGEQIFALATIVGLENDLAISTSLIDLYCKCGIVSNARRRFDEMRKFDEASWNSMLMGFAMNGYGLEALQLFENMRTSSARPNAVTFIALLSGCCHAGLVEDGLRWFEAMKNNYGIVPILEHYSCIIDLLVRAGRLREAVDFIDGSPFKADATMWTSVLGGCKARGDEALARKAADRLIELGPRHSGPYVQLSSLYASHGEWERSIQVRQVMLERRVNKNPGYSWIDS